MPKPCQVRSKGPFKETPSFVLGEEATEHSPTLSLKTTVDRTALGEQRL